MHSQLAPLGSLAGIFCLSPGRSGKLHWDRKSNLDRENFPSLESFPRIKRSCLKMWTKNSPFSFGFIGFHALRSFRPSIFHIFPASNLIFPTFSQLLLADFSGPDLGISAAKTARPGAAVSRTCVTAGPPCWPSTMPLGLSCGVKFPKLW